MALKLFDSLFKAGLTPDALTYSAVMIACFKGQQVGGSWLLWWLWCLVFAVAAAVAAAAVVIVDACRPCLGRKVPKRFSVDGSFRFTHGRLLRIYRFVT